MVIRYSLLVIRYWLLVISLKVIKSYLLISSTARLQNDAMI
ncbi:hypothetical protein D1AOALGA4SA_1354 [Olavius algarvensis Delta 1 endosymbiont]|nr:hypothetical protein D1AOALGA4SA_1354 [Olavius algarvensis Delta 1 endosymbiont]